MQHLGDTAQVLEELLSGCHPFSEVSFSVVTLDVYLSCDCLLVFISLHLVLLFKI